MRKALEILKTREDRHQIIFWELRPAPRVLIAKAGKTYERYNPISGHRWSEFVWNGGYEVEGFGQNTYKTKSLEKAEAKRKEFEAYIASCPRRLWAMPRTLSDFVKGVYYAGSTLDLNTTTIFDGEIK